jgi:beta-phosphoglucomutase
LAHNLALILDMDGVLIDSNPVHRRAWTEYGRHFGIETDRAMLERMYGRRNDDIVRDYFGENLTAEEVRRHGAAKERLYREIMTPMVDEALVPGVREFLERHRDLPIGLASNAGPENVNFVLDASGLRSYFLAVVDGHQAPNPKPHPDLYLLAARLLGADPSTCIVFEDSLAGIQAARAAGMSVVGVRTTHDHLPDVDLEIENFNSPELEPWLGSR